MRNLSVTHMSYHYGPEVTRAKHIIIWLAPTPNLDTCSVAMNLYRMLYILPPSSDFFKILLFN